MAVQAAKVIDEHSVHKKSTIKEFSSVHTFLSTLLFSFVWILEHVLHFTRFRGCRASVSFYWLESCVIALFLGFWGRKLLKRSQARHFLPVLLLHVAVVTAFAVDFNNSAFGISGGSEAYLVSLALAPPTVLLASWVAYQQCCPNRVTVMFVAPSCALVMVLLCAQADLYSEYRVSSKDGAFGIIMTAALGFFVVTTKRYMQEISHVELLYLMNFSCVVCLPFIAVLLGELSALQPEVLKRGKLELLYNLSTMAVLRLVGQAAFLFHLKCSTPLLNVTTRGFSWIWSTIYITILADGKKAELLVPVVLSFCIYGLFTFLPVLLSNIVWF